MRGEKRTILVDGDVAYVTLTNGREAIIDAADVPLIEMWNWCAHLHLHTAYAVRFETVDGKRVTILMHRVILDAPPDMTVDHVDGDGLYNCRANLRLATRFENNRNARRRADNTSGFKGVSWHKKARRWRARIKVNGREKYIGHFTTAEAAHAAYCAEATRLHGEFARTA